MIELPALPPPPPLSANPTPDEFDRYLRWVSEARAREDLLSLDTWRTGDLAARAVSAAASQDHAKAQAATAVAMQANVEAMLKFGKALGDDEPFPI